MSLSFNELQKFLGSVEPFKSLANEELKRIALNAKTRSFSKSETIYNEGDPADSVWILHKGRIKVFKYTSEGKSFAIESLGPGELFGTLCRLGGDNRTYPCAAIAASPTTVIQI